jgi:protease I
MKRDRSAQPLTGRKIAILVGDGFEQLELTSPRAALEAAGATVDVVSPAGDRVRGWESMQWSRDQRVDMPLSEADPEHYDSLVLPGGVLSCVRLRGQPRVIDFIKAFIRARKPVGALGHAVHLLIDADAVSGYLLTSDPVIRNDLENAGADWVNRAMVVDNGLVTGRATEDLPSFNSALIAEIAETPSEIDRHAGALRHFFTERMWGIRQQGTV